MIVTQGSREANVCLSGTRCDCQRAHSVWSHVPLSETAHAYFPWCFLATNCDGIASRYLAGSTEDGNQPEGFLSANHCKFKPARAHGLVGVDVENLAVDMYFICYDVYLASVQCEPGKVN
jgi:hypothetical protein